MDEENKKLAEKLKKELEALNSQEKMLREQGDYLSWKKKKLEGNGEPKSPSISSEPELEHSTTYLVIETKNEGAIRLFQSQLGGVESGFIISRDNPQKLEKKYGFANTSYCWLTSVRASGKYSSIAGLQELSITITRYLEDHPSCVMLLDGLGYLISNNDFNLVLKLVQNVRDKISTSEAVLLIPIDPDVLDKKQFTLLQQECQHIGGIR